MDKLRVFESFAGLGTQKMALRNLGVNHEVVAISEIDPNALISYDAIHCEDKEIDNLSFKEMYEFLESKNVGYDFKKKKVVLPKNEADLRKLYKAHINSGNLGDISKVETSEIPDHDLFTYSYPCQDITNSGKSGGQSEGSGTRSSLLWECKKVISTKKPKYLLMENVKNLLSQKHMPDFLKWLEWLEEQGYKNYRRVIQGIDVNVPQTRERVFVVSILGDEHYEFPESVELTRTLKDYVEVDVDEEYILDFDDYQDLIQEVGDGYIKVNNATKLGYLIAYPYDSVNIAFPKSKTRRGRVGEQRCNTLDRGCTYAFITEDMKFIRLTPRSCWRLMGISDEDYDKAVAAGVNKNELLAQAGNAIIVDVLESIFGELFKEYIN